MENDKAIEVLNSLIEINNDRIEGYETASNETEENDFKILFLQFVKTSQWCKSELVSEVEKLGETPIEGTTTAGKFFRMWMDFKAVVTGNDRQAILNSCEYGESVALNTYNDALGNNPENLTNEQQAIIRVQLELLKGDYLKIQNLLNVVDQN